MNGVCAICDLPTLGDDHWHPELEGFVCADHCDEPECLLSPAVASKPDDFGCSPVGERRTFPPVPRSAAAGVLRGGAA